MRITMLPAIMLGALVLTASAGSADDSDDSNEAGSVGEIAQDVTAEFDALPKAVVAPSYARGLAYSAKSIAQFKVDEPNPAAPVGHVGHAGRSGRR